MSLDDLIAQAGKERPGKKPLGKAPAKKLGGGGGVRVAQAVKAKMPVAGARKGLLKNRPAGGGGGQQQQKQQAPKRLSQMPPLSQAGGRPQQQRQQAPQRASGAANLGVRRGAVQKRQAPQQAAPPPVRMRVSEALMMAVMVIWLPVVSEQAGLLIESDRRLAFPCAAFSSSSSSSLPNSAGKRWRATAGGRTTCTTTASRAQRAWQAPAAPGQPPPASCEYSGVQDGILPAGCSRSMHVRRRSRRALPSALPGDLVS